MVKSKLQILVCAHKLDSHTRNEKPYTAIQVGKALHPDLDFGYLKDNEGENVSENNPFWSEYTAIFWGWKNIKDIKYLGLNHYRRYFDCTFNDDNIDAFFKKHDIIVAKQETPMLSKRERLINLMKVTSQEDAYLFLDTLITLYPKFKKHIIDYFYDSRVSYPYSMFIAPKDIYDRYCSFVFPVFFEMQKKMKSHGYSRQQRAMGYFGEYMLGLFVLCYHLRALPIPVDSCGEARVRIGLMNRIKRMVFTVVYNVLETFERVPDEISVPVAVKAGFKQDGIELKSLC